MAMNQWRIGVVVAAACLLVSTAPGCALAPRERVALHQLYTPSFAAPPPVEATSTSLQKLYAHLRAPLRLSERGRALANQAGVLWLSLSIVLLIAFDFRNLRNP